MLGGGIIGEAWGGVCVCVCVLVVEGLEMCQLVSRNDLQN